MKPAIQEKSHGWKPGRGEVDKLRAGMKGLETRIVNGRRQYPFNLYLEREKIVSFGAHGEMQVIQPLAYKRAFDTYDLHQFIEWEELQGVFEQFPEEKQAYDRNITKIFQEVRQILARVAVDKRA